MKLSKRNFIDYFLLFFTIAVSGIPFFSTSILYLPLFIILLLVFLIRKNKIDTKFLVILFFVGIITGLQTYIFDFFSFQTSLGVFLRIINGYLIIKLLKKKFISYYINILYFLAIISLIIYFPTLIIPSLGYLLSSLSPILNFLNFADYEHSTIVIYNLHHLASLRNSGPFWEPGAFAGYLMPAYMFNFLTYEKDKKQISFILLLAILTTLSTTAYLALFVFLFFAYYEKFKNIFIKIFAVIIILIGAYYSFISFDFLGEKIEYQLSFIDQDPYLENTNTQRFLNILRDVEDFKGHEIVGRGSNPITRYSYELEDQIRTVGLTDILVRMGTPFFILMMYMLYHSICSIVRYYNENVKLYCIGVFLSVLILLMSEVYFNFPLYWSLLFLQLIYKKPNRLLLRLKDLLNLA